MLAVAVFEVGERVSTNQGMQADSRSWKRQRKGLYSGALRRGYSSTNLEFSSVRPILEYRPREL